MSCVCRAFPLNFVDSFSPEESFKGSGICMDFNISLMDVFKILSAVALLIVVFAPKKKGYEYNSLDKKGVVFNIVLSIIYVPLSIAGLFTIFFWDAPATNYSELKILLLHAITGLGFSIPILSIAGIFTSAITRKRGKSKFSFIIQFLPLLVFAVMLILMLFWDKA